jgi:hypothetical protein
MGFSKHTIKKALKELSLLTVLKNKKTQLVVRN